jgi:hypothetical protein
MRPQLISPLISAFFALLAAIFVTLSFIRGTPPARKTWRRIGLIFALVAVAIFILRPQ